MKEQFIEHINSSLATPAPRTATFWRQWSSQAEINLADRTGIIEDFSDYVTREAGNEAIASATIQNITKALDSFWDLVDACAASS